MGEINWNEQRVVPVTEPKLSRVCSDPNCPYGQTIPAGQSHIIVYGPLLSYRYHAVCALKHFPSLFGMPVDPDEIADNEFWKEYRDYIGHVNG